MKNKILNSAVEGFVSRAEDVPEEFTNLNDMFDEFVSWCIAYCESENTTVSVDEIKKYLTTNETEINELIERFKA